MPLDPVAQQLDFSLGAFQSGALEREPDGAAETVRGLLGDDGLPYRRGGSTYKSNAAAGSAGLLWVWDGYVAAGRRTVFGTASAVYVLAADDATPVLLASIAFSGPVRPAVAQGYMLIPGSGIYAGSRKASSYTTGSITVTQGSKVVTGSGTSWLANVDAGMLLQVTGGPEHYAVASVDSDTQVTLSEAFREGTSAGAGYALRPLATPVAATLQQATFPVAVANRLVVVIGGRSYFSTADFAQEMFTTNYHEYPGATVIGQAALRDVLLAFTTGGVYAVSNMAYSLTDAGTGDPQQRRELVNADLVAWGHEGITAWAGSLIVPCLDEVYLVDSLGAPTPIAGRIIDLYLGYVRAGYKPGVAEVFNGHFFLPILTSGNVWVDTLVCRLQPTHSDVRFGWSQLQDFGAEAGAFAERQTSPPLLLVASRRSSSRVLQAGYFTGVATDADGSTPSFALTTIDYPTGGMVSNFVHTLRLRYTGTVPAAEVSKDGGAFSSLGSGDSAGTWRVNGHARNVRFRFTGGDAVRSVEVFVRHSGRQ